MFPSICGEMHWLPRSLHCVAGAPDNGAEEKAGHSGRDDGVGEEKSGPPPSCGGQAVGGSYKCRKRERRRRIATQGIAELAMGVHKGG